MASLILELVTKDQVLFSLYPVDLTFRFLLRILFTSHVVPILGDCYFHFTFFVYIKVVTKKLDKDQQKNDRVCEKTGIKMNHE